MAARQTGKVQARSLSGVFRKETIYSDDQILCKRAETAWSLSASEVFSSAV
jgi:hypothetical protein